MRRPPSFQIPGVFAFLSCSLAAMAACSSAGSGPGGVGAGGTGAVGGGAGADAGSDAIPPPPGETVVVIGPGAGPDAPDKFAGPDDPDGAIEIAYPSTGIVVPPNMNSLEIHFTGASWHDLFEITFDTPTLRYQVYVGCDIVGSGCRFATDQSFWEQVVPTARGTEPVRWTIRGVEAANPAAVGSSETRTLAFTLEDIDGGLYYWNTNGAIQRYDFGFPLAQAEVFLSPPTAGALACVGCHALSRNGTKMAVGMDIPAPAPYKVFDVATRQQVVAGGQPLGGAANFFSFSPDGGQLLYSDGVKIGWRDTTTGNIVNDAAIAEGTMPDWSAGGDRVVYAKPATPPPFGIGIPGVSSGSIEIVPFLGGAFGAPSTLVPFEGENNYYPAFTPSQDWVVFNRSPSNTESFSNAGAAGDGELWAVASAGGNPRPLDAANEGGATSWPKFAPGLHSYHGGTLVWLTFSSPREYGLRLGKGEKVQLWMVAFDAAKAAAGEDPSFPAFWLPFQDIAGGNHIAQWVTKVERQPCTKDTDCAGNEVCNAGVCYPLVK